MTFLIKRENFRGHYFIVVREKGRIRARKRWNQKFTVRKAAGIFRKNKTLDKDISKRKLISRPEFTEVIDKSRKPTIRKNTPFRVVVTGLLKDGTIISASSQARVWDSFQQAKESALTNFYERIAQHFNQEYEADEGLKFTDEIRSIKSNTVMVV